MNKIELLEFSNHLEIKYMNIIEEIHLEYCTVSNNNCTTSDTNNNTISNNDYISFNVLKINNGYRNIGFGSKILSETCKFADNNNIPIRLMPTGLWGADLNRLNNFCIKHGFIMIGDRMVYLPTKKD
jgi:hypothetical protein